jgi:hypothetical protein
MCRTSGSWIAGARELEEGPEGIVWVDEPVWTSRDEPEAKISKDEAADVEDDDAMAVTGRGTAIVRSAIGLRIEIGVAAKL